MTVTAMVDGVTYEIPRWWLLGMARRMSYGDAVRHWHDQEILAARHEAKR